MVCSENYFSTATGLNHGGALSISRHLADLVITYYVHCTAWWIEADHPVPAYHRRPRRPLTRDT